MFALCGPSGFSVSGGPGLGAADAPGASPPSANAAAATASAALLRLVVPLGRIGAASSSSGRTSGPSLMSEASFPPQERGHETSQRAGMLGSASPVHNHQL